MRKESFSVLERISLLSLDPSLLSFPVSSMLWLSKVEEAEGVSLVVKFGNHYSLLFSPHTGFKFHKCIKRCEQHKYKLENRGSEIRQHIVLLLNKPKNLHHKSPILHIVKRYCSQKNSRAGRIINLSHSHFCPFLAHSGCHKRATLVQKLLNKKSFLCEYFTLVLKQKPTFWKPLNRLLISHFCSLFLPLKGGCAVNQEIQASSISWTG